MPTLCFLPRNAPLVHRWTFPSDCEVLVGRSPDATAFRVEGSGAHYRVLLGHSTLSEKHARLRIHEGRVTVEDLGSRAGCLRRLEAGERVPLGERPLWLGPDVAVQCDAERWSLPEHLEELDAEGLAACLAPRLARKGLRATAAADALGLRLLGDARSLHLEPAQSGGTLDPDELRWVTFVVGAWNAARSREPSLGSWRFVALSPSRRRALQQAARVAPTALPVLLVGPSGVGKSVLAQDLHEHSFAARGPFVVVHCAELAGPALDARLFGQAASAREAERPGLLELADGGTLVLDEVTELAPDAQVRLLRVLEAERCSFCRVGEHRLRRAQVRVLATSRQPLTAEGGPLRRELYYRLAGARLELEPLERAELLELGRQWVHRSPSEALRPAEDALEALLALAVAEPWPGGPRELEHALEQCLSSWTGELSLVEHWARVRSQRREEPRPPRAAPERLGRTPASVGKLLADALFLRAAGRSKSRAELARAVGLTYQGADQRLDALGVDLRDRAVLLQREHELQRELREAIGSTPELEELLASLLSRAP